MSDFENHGVNLNGHASTWPRPQAGAGIAVSPQTHSSDPANYTLHSSASTAMQPRQPELWSDRLRGETNKAFTAFADYCELGVQRSIRKLHRHYTQERASNASAPPTLSIGTLFDWSKTYDWPRRATLYDHEEFIRRRAAFAEERSQRQRQVEHEQWELGNKMLRMANEVLDEAGRFTTTKRRVIPASRDRQGRITGPEREIITIGIRAADAIRAGGKAVELMRQAAGLPLQDLRVQDDFQRMGNPQLEEHLIVHAGDTASDGAGDGAM